MSQIKHSGSYRLKAFRSIGKVNAFASRFFEGIHSAIFMGLMKDDVLQEFDTYPFGEWEGASRVDGETRGVEAWMENFIADKVTSKSRVLVVGAGGGRELILLREKGCFAEGVEFDEALFNETATVLAASQGEASFSLKQVERFNLDGEADDFDIVIVPRFYTSYLPGRAERVRFLKACRERLNDDGMLAFDYFTRPESAVSPGSLIFRIQPLISNILRLLRGGRDRKIETGDHLDPQVPLLHHHFNQEGLDSDMVEAGLTSLEQDATWYGWSIAKPFAAKSERSNSARFAGATAQASSEISRSPSPTSV